MERETRVHRMLKGNTYTDGEVPNEQIDNV